MKRQYTFYIFSFRIKNIILDSVLYCNTRCTYYVYTVKYTMTVTYIIHINLFRMNSTEVTFNLHFKGSFASGWCWKWPYSLIPTLKISLFYRHITTQPRVSQTVRMPPTLCMLSLGVFCFLSRIIWFDITGLYDTEDHCFTILLAMAPKARGPSHKESHSDIISGFCFAFWGCGIIHL